MFRLYGEFLATVAPRHVPVQLVIRDAATADPDARAVWAELQAERLAGMTIFATTLHDRGHLRHDVTVDDARDTLWTYNSAELYQLLVIERGWTPEHYGQWIAAALIAALLDGTASVPVVAVLRGGQCVEGAVGGATFEQLLDDNGIDR